MGEKEQIKKFLKINKSKHTFHPDYDDEFYINEIIGIEECNYDDWLGIERTKHDTNI